MAALRTEEYMRYIIIKLIIIIIIIIIIIMAVQTSAWPEEKNKSFGWEANRNQPQHRLKFVVPITQ